MLGRRYRDARLGVLTIVARWLPAETLRRERAARAPAFEIRGVRPFPKRTIVGRLEDGTLVARPFYGLRRVRDEEKR